MSDSTSSNAALLLLHKIVINYEKDAAEFYMAKDTATSKFTGRFDFKKFAKKIFDPIETQVLGQLYVDMLEESHVFLPNNGKSRVGVDGFPYSFVSVPELLINMILAYQLPQQKLLDANKDQEKPFDRKELSGKKEEQQKESGSSIKKRRNSGPSKKGKNVTISPRVSLTPELSAELLKQFLKIHLAPESKLWKTAKYILCPSNCPKQLNTFGEIIAETTKEGTISFNALNYFMHDQSVNSHFDDPTTILHALYIGPLSAQTVEVFATNRSDEFRQRCREILRIALHASKHPMSFKHCEPQYINKNHPDRVKFKDFVKIVTQLVLDLNGEHTGNTGIHTGWACAAIKKFGYKRYVDKTWKDENYYDLIWTVLAQRPQLKKFVVDVLEKNFRDFHAARFWKRMRPHQMNPTVILNQNVTEEDPLKPTEEFLNFPPTMRQILWVGNEKQMREFHTSLEYKVSREEIIHVGVDAEWSAYVSPSKATILQVALSDCVYIIDLESCQISPEAYHAVLSYLFDTPKIVKIGFQFGEDLHQLRAGFRNCPALYKPNNVVCVGKLIMDLMDEVGKLENSDGFKREWLPFLTEDGASASEKESADSITDEGVRRPNESGVGCAANESISSESIDEGEHVKPIKEETVKQQFLNKGLSFICDKLLGRLLDKTEQCSVWNRRPLRSLQMRYAAMDAYCMLMLYEKCKIVFDKLGLEVNQFLSKQSPIRVSLPLLSEEQL